HFHRPADRDGRGVVLARRGRDDRRAVRPGLPHHRVLQPDPVSDHRHRHGDARAARLPEQRPDPGPRSPPHALAQAEPRLRGMSSALSIRGVGKTYEPEGASVEALRDCSFEVRAEEFVAIVGPSGCGKSTLLNDIAGFASVRAGQIYLDGRLLAQPGLAPRPGPDRVVVFQHGALFPWKTVLENVTYGPLRPQALA